MMNQSMIVIEEALLDKLRGSLKIEFLEVPLTMLSVEQLLSYQQF